MKYINLVAAVMMGVSFAVAAPAHEKNLIQSLADSLDVAAHAFPKTPRIHANITACGWPAGHDGATADWVRQTIEQLRGRSDKPPTLSPGACEIPVCSTDTNANNSAIAYCVDDKIQSHNFTLDNWGVLADAAQVLLDTCSPNNERVHGVFMTGAKVFATGAIDGIWGVQTTNMHKACDN